MVSNKTIKIIAVAITIIIILAGFIVFFMLKPKKTISPISQKSLENKIITEKEPSKTLKEYVSDSGFSFKYPEDTNIVKKEITDAEIYEDLNITSSKIAGDISIKIADTKIVALEELFPNTLTPKIVKIGNLKGLEIGRNNKLTANALDEGVLFTVELNSQNEYWLSVYNTTLASFNFVTQEEKNVSEAQVPDDSLGDAVLEEEIVE